MTDELGAGSRTGLPVIETKANDISAYIPTNVISITDGQVFLESDLFYQGIRPAMNAGTSVSRVGGDAQVKAMKKIAGPLRLNLAQFRELAAFAEFGSELDASSLAQLERGRRVVEVLKQPQYQPVPVEEQIVAIYAVTEGFMDDIPIRDVHRFELGLRDYLTTRHGALMDGIKQTGELADEDALVAAIRAFRETFEMSMAAE
jgi:F-type H+-transporting ATPase subunit alpha